MGTLNEDCRTPHQAPPHTHPLPLSPTPTPSTPTPADPAPPQPTQPQSHPFCELSESLGITALKDEQERALASHVPVFLQQFFPGLLKLRQILYFVAEDSIQCPMSSIELGIPEGTQCIIPWGLCSV